MDPVEDFLEHYGVRGMKWGVRRNNTTARLERVANGTASKSDKVKTILGVGSKGYGGAVGYSRAGKRAQARRAADAKKLAKADVKWEKSIYTMKGAVAVHNNVAKQMNGGMLDKLNNNPKYKDKNLFDNPKLQTQYNKDYEKLATQAYSKAITEVHGSSPSGNKTAVYINDPVAPRIEIKSKTVTHADVVEPDLIINLKLDGNGFVIEAASAELKHFDEVDEFLEHFGVRGMKWGVSRPRGSRKMPASEDAASAKTAKKIVKKHGTQALSNKELQSLVTRMNLEQQYSNLSSKKGTSTFSKIAEGQKKVNTVIKLGKTVNDLAQFAQSPTGKAIASEFKKHAVKHTD